MTGRRTQRSNTEAGTKRNQVGDVELAMVRQCTAVRDAETWPAIVLGILRLVVAVPAAGTPGSCGVPEYQNSLNEGGAFEGNNNYGWIFGLVRGGTIEN